MELKNKPLKSGAIVQLEGLILHPDAIEISHGVSIRKPKKEDFETNFPLYGYYNIHQHLSYPTVFWNSLFLTVSPREVQEKIIKTIAILRLFKPGSVKYISYRMYSDAISRMFFGTIGSGDTISALEKYVVTEEDVNLLKTFYDRISPHIPLNFYMPAGR